MSGLIDEARRIGILICPIPSQIEDGDAIERTPDDLLRACSVIGRLCDAIEAQQQRIVALEKNMARILTDCEAPATPDLTDADCRHRCAVIARAALSRLAPTKGDG